MQYGDKKYNLNTKVKKYKYVTKDREYQLFENVYISLFYFPKIFLILFYFNNG